MKIFLMACALLLTGCVGLPENVKPVDHFNADKYLGKWYEIARLDHSFERGLSKVSASYSMRDDGGIRVINRGYDAQKQQGKELRLQKQTATRCSIASKLSKENSANTVGPRLRGKRRSQPQPR